MIKRNIQFEDKQLCAIQVNNVFLDMNPYSLYDLFKRRGLDIHEIRMKKVNSDGPSTKVNEHSYINTAENSLNVDHSLNRKGFIIEMLNQMGKKDSYFQLKFSRNNPDYELKNMKKNNKTFDKFSQIQTFLDNIRTEYSLSKDLKNIFNISPNSMNIKGNKDKKQTEIVVVSKKEDIEHFKNYELKFDAKNLFWLTFKSIRDKDEFDLKRIIKISNHYQAQELDKIEMGTITPNRDYLSYWNSTAYDKIESNFVYGFNGDKLSNKASVIVDFIKYSSLLKIEFNFKHVESVTVDKTNSTVFIKMMCPPRYYFSDYEESSYLAPKYNEKNWERIPNFGLDKDVDFLLKNYLEQSLVLSIKMRDSEIFKKLIEKLESTLKENYFTANLRIVPLKENQPWITMKKLANLKADYEIKYLILSCLSQMKINIFEIDENFFNTLVKLDEEVCQKTLDDIASKSRKLKMDDQQKMKKNFLEFFFELFKHNEQTKSIWSSMKTPDHMKKTRRVTITPTTIIYYTKEAELSNCILERHSALAEGYFMRVTISDEMGEQTKNMNFISRRYTEPLVKLHEILGRKFKFFAYSSSQLRGNSFWMFSEDNPLKLEIRQLYKEIGDLSEILVAAKYGARLGQLLSSSYSVLKIDESIKIEEIPDIKTPDGKFTFSDGVGKISLNLIQKIKEKMKIHGTVSAIQIRCGGLKGILVGDPEIGDNVISIRPSMKKFKDSVYRDQLQLLDYSKFRYGYLNRQIITLLVSLGLETSNLSKLQEECCKKLSEQQVVDGNLFAYVNHVHNLSPTKNLIKEVVQAGINIVKEPFIKGVLDTIRIRSFINLKEKSNILIEESVRVMGVLDEYGILNEGEIYVSYSISGGLEDDVKIVEQDEVVVTKNPCLHPGDIRVLKARGDLEVREKFSHIVNCVVFPQKGRRPHTAEISGSDLDGDLYFVTWNQSLVPQNKNVEICEYDTVKPENQATEVTPNEIVEFFMKYINNDVLGKIDNTHLALADKEGAYSYDCIELAKEHAIAVDFAKSGICPKPNNVKIRLYPDFMERDEEISYESNSVLGKLYREAKNHIENANLNEKEDERLKKIQIDKDMIHPNYTHHIKQALIILDQYYESIENILNIYNVESEFEIYSGNFRYFMLSASKKRFNIEKLQEKMVTCMEDLRNRFEKLFMEGIDAEADDAEDVALAKASAWYIASYFNVHCQNQEIKTYFENNLANEYEIIRKKIEKLKTQYIGLPWIVVSGLITDLKARKNELGNGEINLMEN